MYIPWFSMLLNTLEQLLLRLDGYIIDTFKVELVQQDQTLFFINNYSRIHHFNTGRLNELVNSNDNHVHTIIGAFCEALGLR